MKTTFGVLLAAAGCLYAVPALAQTVTIPNTFVAGTPAKAADVNANFGAVAAAVNGLGAAIKPSAVDATGCGSGNGICAAMPATADTVQTINQVSITTAGSGMILVFFTGSVECNVSTSGTGIEVWGQIAASVTTPTLGDGLALFRAMGTTGLYFDSPMDAHRAFAVTAAGTYTYYYNAIKLVAANGCNFYGGNMSAMFIPQ